MTLSQDTDQTLRAARELVNTDRVDGERLGDQSSLDEYLDSFGWTGRRDRDDAELAEVHKLRARVGRIWEASDDEPHAVGQVNALLSDTLVSPWLTRHAEMPEWHLHFASNHDPLAQRVGAEIAMALADLIRAKELRRLKICASPHCTAVLVDLSAINGSGFRGRWPKNHSRECLTKISDTQDAALDGYRLPIVCVELLTGSTYRRAHGRRPVIRYGDGDISEHFWPP